MRNSADNLNMSEDESGSIPADAKFSVEDEEWEVISTPPLVHRPSTAGTSGKKTTPSAADLNR